VRHADFIARGVIDASLVPDSLTVDAPSAFRWINRYTRSFLLWHLLADPGAHEFLESAPAQLNVPAGMLSVERLPPR
jgi:hypothetical protein